MHDGEHDVISMEKCLRMVLMHALNSSRDVDKFSNHARWPLPVWLGLGHGSGYESRLFVTRQNLLMEALPSPSLAHPASYQVSTENNVCVRMPPALHLAGQGLQRLSYPCSPDCHHSPLDAHLRPFRNSRFGHVHRVYDPSATLQVAFLVIFVATPCPNSIPPLFPPRCSSHSARLAFSSVLDL